jgi:hypothetical protein
MKNLKLSWFLAFQTLAMCVALDAADVNLTVDYSTVVRTLAADFHGVNYVAYWDSIQGSTGSREALRRAGGAVDYIRFPGGAPADWYDWANPLADGWSSTTPLQLWNYANAAGAKVIFQTNPTSNHNNNPSGVHAADWVTYCVNNGINAPLWEVGNEPDLNLINDWDFAAMQWYFDKFNEQAPAMRARNPSIKVAGPVGANAWFWWGRHSLEMFLQRCGNNADAISLHWYYTGGDPTYDQIKIAAQNWQPNMDYIRSVTTKPLYITEWNAMGFNDNSDVNKWAGLAIANTDVIGAYAKSGVAGHVMFGCIHNVHHNWGILGGSGDYRAADSPSPNYFVLPLWSKMGDRVLNVSGAADPSNVVSAWAHKRSNGDVQVMIINKATTSRSVGVSFTGFNAAGKTVRITELRSSNGSATSWDTYYNGVLNPQPATADLPADSSTTSSGATFTRTVPGISATVLDFINTSTTPTFTTTATPAPANVVKSTTTTITLSVTCTAGSLTDGVVDLEIYNAGGTRVAQQYWTAQSFSSGQTRTYTYTWTAPATVGTYYIKGAVFTSGWATLLHWNDNAGTVKVVDQAVRRNSGGAAAGWFAADANFSGGNTSSTTAAINMSGVTDPAPQAVYQSERWGACTYTITGLAASASHTVRLHLAEIYWSGANQRKFHVNINGTRVLTDFDVFATAGAKNKAIVRQFTATSNGSGQITIQFLVGAVDQPKISGIEVIR